MSLVSQLRGRAAARAAAPPAPGSSAVQHTAPPPTARPGPPPHQQQRHSNFRPQQQGRTHRRFSKPRPRSPSPQQFRPDRLALRQVGVLPPSVQPEEVQPLKTGLAVTWLGTSSGTPTIERNVSCTVVRAPGHTYLVDCGEGTHRQLPTVDFDMHTIHSIFITHLHGDHCYGLGTTLLAVDEAKAQAQRSASHRENPNVSAETNGSSLGRTQGPQQQQQQQQQQQEEPTIYVYGPPGLAELLRAQLVITGSHHAFHCRVMVTELVTNLKDAMTTPQPIGPSNSRLQFCRLPPQNKLDHPSLVAASNALAPRLSQLQTIWQPYNPFKHGFNQRPRNDPPQPQSLEQSFDGRNYVATEGLFWDLPSGAMRVMAAQLQHRVPCWGYVLRETKPFAPGMKKRKVTILGDTVNSKAIAPLALGTDMLAHEATFIEGMEHKCRIAQHSTGWMAGEFAWAVQAKTLVLTHFSARYNTGKKGPKSNSIDGDDGESVEREVAMQNSAIRALLAETRSRYKQGTLMAASDFFTFHVPFKIWPPVGPPPRKAAPHTNAAPSPRQLNVLS